MDEIILQGETFMFFLIELLFHYYVRLERIKLYEQWSYVCLEHGE